MGTPSARPEALAHLRHPRPQTSQQAPIGTRRPANTFPGVVDVQPEGRHCVKIQLGSIALGHYRAASDAKHTG